MTLYSAWSKALRDAVVALSERGEQLTIGALCRCATQSSETALDLLICFSDQLQEEGLTTCGYHGWESPCAPDYVGPLGPSIRSNEEVVALVERVIAGRYLRERADALENE